MLMYRNQKRGLRSMDDNRYYNDAKMKPTINNSLASKLLRLEHKHKYLYVLLNALFDILLKPIPIFVYSLATYNNTSIYKNVIQKVFSFSFIVIGAYLSAIAIYFFILYRRGHILSIFAL